METRTAKINHFLLFWILLVIILIYGRPILVPLTFSIMLSMLMYPVIDFLDRLGCKRVFSTLLCVIILLGIIVLIVLILIGQISSFKEELPLIEQKINALIASLYQYLEKQYQLPIQLQEDFFQKQVKSFSQSSATYFTQLLSGVTQLFANIAIILVITFLLLFDKERYHAFFLRLMKRNNENENLGILNKITNVAQHYLKGRLFSMFILFLLYYLALVIIGVKNALLLSAVAALVNIIPYAGPLLAGVFPVLIALVTKDSYEPVIWVIVLFTMIQGIDNYFVTPFVMGGEVNLSALATILIIICGGFLWGIAGMILFVPMLSIAKIVFDHVDSLKPYGYLIGDPANERPSLKLKRWWKKFGRG